jgi:hypothetical protein
VGEQRQREGNTSFNFVDCWSGRVGGFSPRGITAGNGFLLGLGLGDRAMNLLRLDGD